MARKEELKSVCFDACYFGIENRIEYLFLCDKNMKEVKAITGATNKGA